MRFDLTRHEFEALYDLASGEIVKSQRKHVENFVRQFYGLRYPSKAPDKGGWSPTKAPIRSSWPSGHVKASGGGHWSFQRQSSNNNKPKPPTPKMSADDILADLSK